MLHDLPDDIPAGLIHELDVRWTDVPDGLAGQGTVQPGNLRLGELVLGLQGTKRSDVVDQVARVGIQPRSTLHDGELDRLSPKAEDQKGQGGEVYGYIAHHSAISLEARDIDVWRGRGHRTP